jgi:hypothetical protein
VEGRQENAEEEEAQLDEVFDNLDEGSNKGKFEIIN